MRWHTDSRTCSHSNEDACPTCDFDRYYANNYPDCPWREIEPYDDLPPDTHIHEDLDWGEVIVPNSAGCHRIGGPA